MSAAIETRLFDQPDQLLDMKARGRISIVKMADGTAGMHAIFEPGWVWEVTKSRSSEILCRARCATPATASAGSLVVRMVETNMKTNIGPGDFFEIPAGHDAYVEGHERVELVLFAPPEHAHDYHAADGVPEPDTEREHASARREARRLPRRRRASKSDERKSAFERAEPGRGGPDFHRSNPRTSWFRPLEALRRAAFGLAQSRRYCPTAVGLEFGSGGDWELAEVQTRETQRM